VQKVVKQLFGKEPHKASTRMSRRHRRGIQAGVLQGDAKDVLC